MAGEAAAAMLAVQTVQLLLTSMESSLAFGSYQCPLAASIDTVTSTTFDYIIVGGGSAGSVLASRLSESSDVNVLLLEAGGCPPFEAVCPGYFTLQPQSSYDYNITSKDDGYSCQNLQGGSSGLTVGKMLGGSSSIHHMIWVRGTEPEYDTWADAAGDDSWNYDGLLRYFKKSENVVDLEVLADPSATKYVGVGGPTKLTRELNSENDVVIQALAELSYTYVNNSNTNYTNGVVTNPLLQIGDSVRQGSLTSYLTPVANRSNLYVLTGATVSKINFDSDNVATGVTFTYSDTEYTVAASSEVILSAGALLSPQLLMLSGVGPSDHLTDMGIDVVSDLPVGDNLQDHPSASMIFGLDSDTAAYAGASPFVFPVPVTTSYINLSNSTTQLTEYQSINLVFPHDSAGLLQLCMNSFKYTETICDAMNAAYVGRNVMWAVANLMHPVSRGTVRLSSTSISDHPTVTLGLLSNSTDLVNLATFLAHMASIVNTTTFTNIGAEFIDLDLCTDETKYSTEYWQCYALAMSSTMWHYCGTAAIGTVVDAKLLVNGVSNLRVVDASVFPTVPAGNINSNVIAVAEKAADMIIAARSSNLAPRRP